MDAYSRCTHCEDHAFQCTGCQMADKRSKSALKAAKRAAQTLPCPALADLPSAGLPPPAVAANLPPVSPALEHLDDLPHAQPHSTPLPPANAQAQQPPEPVAKKKRARGKKAAPEKKPEDVPMSDDSDKSGSGSDSDDADVDGAEDGDGAKRPSKPRKKSMLRIQSNERVCVENWLQKTRKDGAMKNARWIRNGGAKHATMTATSAEVKTQGAYESLALYVNKNLNFGPVDPRVWDVDIAKRRWISIYKSFKEALLLDAKGNSNAGCTLAEIETNSTNLLQKQKLKCASFEVLFAL